MTVENIIEAFAKDIMHNATIAVKDPSFAAGKFGRACLAQGDNLRAVVERFVREEVEHRLANDFGNTAALLHSDKSRQVFVAETILAVVKRLVSLAAAT